MAIATKLWYLFWVKKKRGESLYLSNPLHQMEGITPGFEGDINQQGKGEQKKDLLPTVANLGSNHSAKLQKPCCPLLSSLCPLTR